MLPFILRALCKNFSTPEDGNVCLILHIFVISALVTSPFSFFQAFDARIRFQTIDEVIGTTDRHIREVPKTPPPGGIGQHPELWKKVIEQAGDYFEGLQKN